MTKNFVINRYRFSKTTILQYTTQKKIKKEQNKKKNNKRRVEKDTKKKQKKNWQEQLVLYRIRHKFIKGKKLEK